MRKNIVIFLFFLFLLSIFLGKTNSLFANGVPPSPPQNLKLDGQRCGDNNGNIIPLTNISQSPTLTWDPVASASYYQISLCEGGSVSCTNPFSDTVTSTSVNLSSLLTSGNLKANTTYSVMVSACNNMGCSMCVPAAYPPCVDTCNFTTAASSSSGGVHIPNPLSANDIPSLLANIISFVFELSLILGPLAIVIGALYLLTSAGSVERVNRGKAIIVYTLIGMAIIILSRLIIELIKSIVTK